MAEGPWRDYRPRLRVLYLLRNVQNRSKTQPTLWSKGNVDSFMWIWKGAVWLTTYTYCQAEEWVEMTLHYRVYFYGVWKNKFTFQRTAFFRVITGQVVVIFYRLFGTIYRSHPQGSRIQNGCRETSVRNYHYSPITTQKSAVLTYFVAEASNQANLPSVLPDTYLF